VAENVNVVSGMIHTV